MARIERVGVFNEVPKNVLFGVIEVISNGLLDDAKSKLKNTLGFKTDFNISENAIETIVKFFPYRYHFRWEITENEKGRFIRLVGRTPGRFWEPLLDMNFKLESIIDTQWAALTNFSIGYMTAQRGFKSRKEVKKIGKGKGTGSKLRRVP
jgi:hypothetical protein